MKKCPYCAKEIEDEAIKCKHCSEWLSKEVQIRPQVLQAKEIEPPEPPSKDAASKKSGEESKRKEAGQKQCPTCGKWDVYRAVVEDGGQGDWCPHCNKSIPKEKKLFLGDNIYYSISIDKLIILLITTFGIYQFLWFWNHWDEVQKQQEKEIYPIWRAVFSFLFCYQLFKKILYSAENHGYTIRYSPGLLTIAYIIPMLTHYLPGSWWFLSFFSFIPLLVIQTAANVNNINVVKDYKENDKYSQFEIALVIIGGVFVVLALIGSFMPE